MCVDMCTWEYRHPQSSEEDIGYTRVGDIGYYELVNVGAGMLVFIVGTIFTFHH